MTYTWTMTGGTITAGGTSNQITFTAGAVGTLSLGCTVANTAGTQASSTASVNVVAAPVATSLVASSTTPLYGATINLTPSFSGGTATIDHSIGTVTSGTPVSTAAITSAITYTLTVTNAANDTATATVTVTPQTVVVAAISPANPIVTVLGSRTFSSSVSGAVNTGIVWSATGGSIVSSTGVWTAPASPGGPFTITATSAADSSKTATTTVTAVAAPVATITAPTSAATGATGLTASVPAQTGMTYAWTISGGTITSATNTNSITFTAGSVGTLTLGCTVTNAANTNAVGSATVTVSTSTAPQITVQPANAQAIVPDGATFTVTATGSDLHYLWRQDGTTTVGTDSPNYTVSATDLNTFPYQTTYSVVVSNTGGSVTSNNAVLTVVAPSPTYAGDPVANPSRPLTTLPSYNVNAQRFPNGSFRFGYDETLKDPVWTSYGDFKYITAYTLNSNDPWLADDRLAAPQVTDSNYSGSGWSRGHEVMQSDIGRRYGQQAADDSCRMSNIVPQDIPFNNNIWNNLETKVAMATSGSLVDTFGRIWIYTGPVFGASPPRLGTTNIGIPEAYYKIMVRETAPGQPKVLAMLVPHPTVVGDPTSITPDKVDTWKYTTSVARIEQLTGLDLFPSPSTPLPAEFKTKVDVRTWGTPFEQSTTNPNVHMVQPSWNTSTTYSTTLTFAGDATSSDSTIASTGWTFGDGGTATGTSATHAYAAGGTFTVTFTATEADGHTASITRTITVSGPVNNPPTITAIANQTTAVNTAKTVGFTVGDTETAPAALVVTTNSANTTLIPNSNLALTGPDSSGVCSLVITPATGLQGTASITVTVTDGGSQTATRTFTIAVGVPTITTISNQTTAANTPVTVTFTVNDTETAPAGLVVTATSSNTTLVPNANLVLTGPDSGGACSYLITPASGQTGSTTITITVSDGTSTAQTSFNMTVDGSGTPTLIISQYYEGATGTNRFIEITNIGSQAATLDGIYLAGYMNKTSLSLDGVAPTNKDTLTGTLAAGASKLYMANGATTPSYAVALGTIATSCSFNGIGGDIIIISTSNGTSCWTDRIDVVGTTGDWGLDTSFYRAATIHLPNKTYTPSEWVQVSNTSVDNAAPTESQYLGYHVVTP